jgi:hypothetical protein
VTTDLAVKATDKSVRINIFDRLKHNPNFPVTQQILFFIFLKCTASNIFR